ncbi:MAG TPA: AMIN domain-containing protein, partial [Candidatus Acidoferrales bacterium]|nr:AMIN domain-containing protein [Candidatus Acidoferrales bacterium]
MKTNWPAYRLACLLMASLAFFASPVSAQTGSPPPQPASAQSTATLIAQVEVSHAGLQTSVRVEGNGRLPYQVSRLNNPERLVLDFSGVHLALARTRIPSTSKPVLRVRLGQFKPDVVRAVIDLERAVPYRLEVGGRSVTVAFATAAPRQVTPRTSVPPVGKPAARPRVDIAAQPPLGLSDEISAMSLPAALTQPTAALAAPLPPAQAQAPATTPQQQEQQPPPGQQPPPQQQEQQPPPPPPQQPPPQAAQQPTGKYSGEPISVNLKDVDLKDFFRLIHEISGLNVVVDPAVKGSLTLVLDDVPWDQALDIVLRNNGLDKQLDGNVLRLATKDTLKKEAEGRRDLAKAEAEAVDQVTATRVLSYAKATALRDTLKRFLSSRGDILAD